MSQQEARPYKRKIIYIHKAFQRSFILKFCLIALCAIVLASLILYLLSKDSMTATYRYHHLALQRTGEAIMPALIVTNVIILVGLLIATIIVTLYVSHKIGGPLYRLNNSLESIGKGDLTLKIRLRHHDQLMDFASSINQMTMSLKDRVQQIQKEVTALKDKIQKGESSAEEIKEDTEKLHHTVHRLFETGE